MTSQSPGNLNRDNFETPPWESRDKKPFRCRCREKTQIILYGGKWWFPPSPSRGESCESRVCPSTKGVQENDLTNLLVGLMQVRVSN